MQEEGQLKRIQFTGRGLKEIPEELFESKDSLEILDLSNNHLSHLPDRFAEFSKLKTLFLSNNQFEEYPQILGKCLQLEMVAFRNNQMKFIPPSSFPPLLRWLILTDNQLKQLPEDIGNCSRLEKLMLAGNLLSSLPSSISRCLNLHLIRLSVNQFTQFPKELLDLPNLSWIAFNSNPFSTFSSSPSSSIPLFSFQSLVFGEKLGEGASGVIYKATVVDSNSLSSSLLDSPHVAVKIFKGQLTSDGNPQSEMEACISFSPHPHLIPVLAKLKNHPEGQEGLIMKLIDSSFINLGGPPTFDTCSRDVYPPSSLFSEQFIYSLAKGMASACFHLHSHGILHGDFYSHNILYQPSSLASILGDFGAASFFDPLSPLSLPLQRFEVRAFGYLLQELLSFCPTLTCSHPSFNPSSPFFPLLDLSLQCLSPSPPLRPTFLQILHFLDRLSSSVQKTN